MQYLLIYIRTQAAKSKDSAATHADTNKYVNTPKWEVLAALELCPAWLPAGYSFPSLSEIYNSSQRRSSSFQTYCPIRCEPDTERAPTTAAPGGESSTLPPPRLDGTRCSSVTSQVRMDFLAGSCCFSRCRPHKALISIAFDISQDVSESASNLGVLRVGRWMEAD